MRSAWAIAALVLCVRVAEACTCVSTVGMPEARDVAPVVFVGRVKTVAKLPEHPKMRGQQRYVATFAVERQWRGGSARELKVYGLGGAWTCLDFGYEKGKSYLVFADAVEAKDWVDGDYFIAGWTDVVAVGARMLLPTACTPGGRTSDKTVREEMRRLGRGRQRN